MKTEDLIGFLKSYGVGEYQVSVLPNGCYTARPLAEDEMIVKPILIMEMIAARDAKKAALDL